MPTPDLLTTSDAMEVLGLERSTISRMVKEGRMTAAMKLPGLRGAFLFDPAEVDRVAAALRGEAS